jgi:hypothetical protein
MTRTLRRPALWRRTFRFALCFAGVPACSRAGLDVPGASHDPGETSVDAGGTRGAIDAGSDATLVEDSGASSDSGTETLDASTPDTGDSDIAPETDASVVSYTLCAYGVSDPDNGVYLNVAGIELGATLTLTQSGNVLTATYEDGTARSFTFEPTTSTSATLAPMAGQTVPGLAGLCVLGPGDEFPFPATLSATAGTLTHDRGVVYLAIDGTLEGDGGACGAESSPASYCVLCGAADGGLPSFEAEDASTPAAPELSMGMFTCVTEVGSKDGNTLSGGGATGTLNLTQVAGEVTAVYSGDSFVDGTLLFTATTATTAIGEPDQTLQVSCLGPTGMGGGSAAPQTLSLASTSIAIAGSTVFVSFAGTMAASASCAGAVVAGSLVCTAVAMK